MDDAPTAPITTVHEFWTPIPTDVLKGPLQSNLELSEIEITYFNATQKDGFYVR